MAVSEALSASHLMTCKSWRQSREGLSYENMARQAGTRRPDKSTDIHWPLTLSLRNKEVRSSERFRSAAGQFRRWTKKATKGWGPFSAKAKASRGRSSGSQAPETRGTEVYRRVM